MDHLTPSSAMGDPFCLSPGPESNTVNPLDVMSPGVMTPQSEGDDEDSISTQTPDGKQHSKKRKSWGQILPEPTTNLPPRKRAKTKDEKEQRRIERVLRNRKAAQQSRERKRLEVDALEQECDGLKAQLEEVKKQNELLLEQLRRFEGGGAPLLRNTPITLTPQLFGEASNASTSSHLTVNPATLSPQLSPAPGAIETAEPLVSNVGGASQVVHGLPGADLASEFGSSSFGHTFSHDESDAIYLASGLLDSPLSSAVDDDHFESDFDIHDFLHRDDGGFAHSGSMAANDGAAAANPTFDFSFDSTDQILEEDPFLQPQSGASAFGCDDGGTAVR